MSVPHPGGDPNARLYEQLKTDVLKRVPQITTIQYVPDEIIAKQLRATFDPARLPYETGPEPPTLSISCIGKPHTTGSVSTTPTQTRGFMRAGIRTKTTRTSGSPIFSTELMGPPTDDARRSTTKRRR